MLVLLSALWGSSYMFIKVAVAEIPPTAMIALRLALAGSVLFAVLALQSGGLRGALEAMRGVGRGALVLGVINSALPFTLIAWGETHIDSGIASIANAAMPIFVAILAFRYRASERVAGARLLGVVIGLAGVGVVSGANPEGGWWGAAGALACAAAAFLYAVGALYAQTHLEDGDTLVVVTTATLAGGLFLLPFAVAQPPDGFPSLEVAGSLLVLSWAGLVVGLLLYYHLIAEYGTLRASLVVYLVPLTAVLYGAVLLDEELSASALFGLGLILGGVALGSGVAQQRRRRPAPAAAP